MQQLFRFNSHQIPKPMINPIIMLVIEIYFLKKCCFSGCFLFFLFILLAINIGNYDIMKLDISGKEINNPSHKFTKTSKQQYYNVLYLQHLGKALYAFSLALNSPASYPTSEIALFTASLLFLEVSKV